MIFIFHTTLQPYLKMLSGEGFLQHRKYNPKPGCRSIIFIFWWSLAHFVRLHIDTYLTVCYITKHVYIPIQQTLSVRANGLEKSMRNRDSTKRISQCNPYKRQQMHVIVCYRCYILTLREDARLEKPTEIAWLWSWVWPSHSGIERIDEEKPWSPSSFLHADGRVPFIYSLSSLWHIADRVCFCVYEPLLQCNENVTE